MNSKSLKARVLLTILLGFSASTFANAQTSPRRFQEAFVLRAMRQLQSAQVTYSVVYGNGQYATLEQLRQREFIDAALGTGEKYGYLFAVSITTGTPQTPSSFYMTATPRVYRKTGLRSFYVDISGDYRGGDLGGRVATSSDPIIDVDLCANGGIAVNESCTLEDMRVLSSSQFTFSASVGNGNFGTLAELHAYNLISQRLSTGMTRGYLYTVTIVNRTQQNPATFRISAVPQTYGVTGIRSFFIGTDGILRGADRQGAPADENDPPCNE